MPLLTELGWFFSLRGYKDAAPLGLLLGLPRLAERRIHAAAGSRD